MDTILFLGANPQDTTRLALDREVREVTECLLATELGRSIRIAKEWAVRPRDLHGHLMRHQPVVVHFSGHGSSAGQIILEDDRGMAAPISKDALATLLGILGKKVRCVVLNACYSADQASLLAKRVDCVVGMSTAVKDAVAIAFSTSFYQALAGFGQSVQVAFELGCNQIDLSSLSQADVPRLLRRDGVNPEDVRLFTDVR